MTDIRWILPTGYIRSWHIEDGANRGLCGRTFTSVELRDRLGQGRSCENCLRQLARKTDAAVMSEREPNA
jgi:hypothetical protein